MVDLLLQHRRHHVGHCPHALADLCLARQPAFQTDIDIEVLVCADPRLALDKVLAAERARLHRGVDFVAGAVKKAGVDEADARFCGADTFLEVHRGAAFLVHDADLDGIARQAEHILHTVEGADGKANFLRSVHLGLHDINRPFDRIAAFALEVMHRDQRRDCRIHQPFEHLVSVTVKDCGVGHQVAHVAHQHERTSLERYLAPIRRGIGAIAVQPAGHGLAALFERVLKIAAHQAKPVAIGQHLVLRIDAGDGVFAIHDRGNRAFHHHIGQPCLITAANGVRSVKDQFDVQPVVAQQNRVGRFGMTGKADEFFGLGKRHVIDQKRAVMDVIAPRVRVAAAVNRESLVKEHAGTGHDTRAAPLVIAAFRRGAAHRVGAVEPIIKASPPRIGRVQCVARVGDRHDKLRSGGRGEFRVGVFRLDLEIRTFGQKVADFLEESAVFDVAMGHPTMFHMPCVDLGLQILAILQKVAILEAEVVNQVRQAGPEIRSRHTRPRKGVVFNKINQFGCNLQTVDRLTFGHFTAPPLRVARH